VNGTSVRLLLGLAPPDEQAIEEVLYGSEQLTIVAGGASASELIALASVHAVDGVLLSQDLPGLDAGCVSRLRVKGVRMVGVALSDAAAVVLGEYDVDVVARPPLALADLLGHLHDLADDQPRLDGNRLAVSRVRESARRRGNILAVLGSKGAPGASELAASFAAVVAPRWPVLLTELDGDGGQLALRLDADPQEGSVLGLARALRRNEPELRELLSRWLVGGERGWPWVLLGPPDPQRTLSDLVVPGVAQAVLDVLADEFALVVCDVGSRLSRAAEPDATVRLHRDVLVSADAVVLVLGQRQEQLHAGFGQLELLLHELTIPVERLRVVVNGQGGPGAAASADTVAAITRELGEQGLTVDAWLPWDARTLRASVRLGLPLALARPQGGYAKKLGGLVDSVLAPTTAQPLARKRRLQPAAPEVAESGAVAEVALPWRR
jgi:Flp pilus assembly CpaE family ATPase